MNAHKEYQLIPVKDNLKQKVIALLQESNLPVSDLDEQKELFAVLQNNEVAGTGGLELFANCGLLRSVSVRKDLQGKGLGKFINRELEKISKQRGIDCIYLLTTTAKDFFSKEGYEVIARDDVPESIKNTTEFSTVCPSSATVMKKNLA
jgi:amino-acid N-acetyltransferase